MKSFMHLYAMLHHAIKEHTKHCDLSMFPITVHASRLFDIGDAHLYMISWLMVITVHVCMLDSDGPCLITHSPNQLNSTSAWCPGLRITKFDEQNPLGSQWITEAAPAGSGGGIIFTS